MKVELKKLELSNYRNISHATYVFDGNSKIVGENRIGKTNTLEAIVWLLTDKLLNGSNDIAQIKPLKDTKLEVRVEGTFSLWDDRNPQIPPRIVVLRKEYGEDWIKTRGTEDLVFKGHYLSYYYNGVKQKTQKDYLALFMEDFGINGTVDFKGIDLVQMLTNPYYLGDLGESDKWKDLRAFIIALIGDVNDDDVFAKDSSLLPLKEDLYNRMGRVDEVKKYYSNEIKGIQEQIIGVDAQVKMLEETKQPTESEVAIAKKEIESINEEIATLQGNLVTDAAVVDIREQINKKNALIIKLQSENNTSERLKDINKKHIELNNKYRDLLVKKAGIKEEIGYNERGRVLNEEEINKCNEKRSEYIKRLREIDFELLKPFDAMCPICHRPLEGEELEKAKNTLNSDLLSEKERIIEEGKKNKELKESKIQENVRFAEENENLVTELSNIESELKKTLECLSENASLLKEEENKESVPNPQIEELTHEVKELENKILVIKADNNALNIQVRERIEEKQNEKTKYQTVLDDYAYFQRQMAQLDTIKTLKKDLTKKLASTEQKKELLNAFIKTKLEMLDENVARVFGNIKFQLIKENINGGYDPICKPYIYDVDKDKSTNITWRSGSKSEMVITGIATCEKIKAALGLADLPFLFDEGGEISTSTFDSKFKTKSQLICVKVTDNITTPMVMKI